MVRSKLKRWLMWVAALSLVAGCANMSERERCILTSAAVGGVAGGGIGTGVALSKKNEKPYLAWVVPTGVVGGAVLGGVAGYFFCEAEAPPPPPPAPPPAPEKIILRGVHFDFDKAVIRSVDRPVLDEAAETLKSKPNVKVYVNGYCDAIGTVPYNLKLSQRRSEAVSAYLEDKGIPASQLTPQGFGKTHFVATNKTREGRAQNRRVELVPADQQ